MLRKVVFTIFVLFCFVLQSSVFGLISFFHTVPNLMIIVTACIGFMRGEREGLLTGFVCGMLMDVFFGDFLGFNALLFMYIGYLNGKFFNLFFKEDIKLPIILVISSDFTYGILYYVFLFLLRGRFDFGYYFMNVILPEVVFTILVTVFLYPVILKINDMIEDRERRSEQKFV